MQMTVRGCSPCVRVRGLAKRPDAILPPRARRNVQTIFTFRPRTDLGAIGFGEKRKRTRGCEVRHQTGVPSVTDPHEAEMALGWPLTTWTLWGSCIRPFHELGCLLA